MPMQKTGSSYKVGQIVAGRKILWIEAPDDPEFDKNLRSIKVEHILDCGHVQTMRERSLKTYLRKKPDGKNEGDPELCVACRSRKLVARRNAERAKLGLPPLKPRKTTPGNLFDKELAQQDMIVGLGLQLLDGIIPARIPFNPLAGNLR